ncbi:hypothetical protein LTR85_002380 [Meristemomyces frigidus]|nr:hypothetical protein LTR85_002380 [Meristemomyces frigidus]
MQSAPASQRPDLVRTSTWPPTIRAVSAVSATHDEGDSGPVSAMTESTPSLFEEHPQDHPEDHFLSPMYEHEDWDDDSDDDGEEVEWDAGITDFALFDDDKRRTQEGQDRLSSRWEHFMSTQQLALRRAAERARSNSTPDTTRPPLPFDQMPSLTPDSSPNLHDDLDAEPHQQLSSSRSGQSGYLTITLTPPPEDERTINDDDDLPLSLYVQRVKEYRKANRKLERPGLRHSRNMSGKAHVWRRPSWHIYSVGEEPDAERRAELGMVRPVEDDEVGRGSA